jgi:hypothetical protein
MGFGAASSSPVVHVPRKAAGGREASATPGGVGPTATAEAASSGAGNDAHLAALRAKIQEKRKKLQRMKQDEGGQQQQQQQQQQRAVETTAIVASVGAGGEGRGGEANAALAARNAIRFGILAPPTTGGDLDATTTKTALGRLLPTDLRDRRSKDEDAPAARGGAEEDDEDDRVEDDDDGNEEGGGGGDLDLRILSNARSLVGTCTSMCPDEELLRREKEGDIQLLEVSKVPTVDFA